MARAFGVVCDKDTIHYTSVVGPDHVVEEEVDLKTPTSKQARGEQLAWLLDEAEQLFRRLAPDLVYMQKPGTGGMGQTSPERIEVGAIVQLAAERAGVRLAYLLTEQIRAKQGIPKARGAYDGLLRMSEVAARSNSNKRERFLYAITALKELGE